MMLRYMEYQAISGICLRCTPRVHGNYNIRCCIIIGEISLRKCTVYCAFVRKMHGWAILAATCHVSHPL